MSAVCSAINNLNNKNYENVIDALVYNTPITNLPDILFFGYLFN